MKDFTNKIFDINKFPDDWGIILFPISMSRIANAQSPEACLELIRKIIPSKALSPKIGLHFVYTESLYLDHDIAVSKTEDPHKKRINYMQEVEKHAFGMKKIIDKLKTTEFQVPSAFEFMSWDQSIINTKSFASRFSQLRKIFDSDTLFQKYLKEDIEFYKRKYNEAQINFFLEEHLLTHFFVKNEVSLSNRHVQDRQKWILWCYPGKPQKALIYLHQLNPFGLNWPESKFENIIQYDLSENLAYDASKIDLETFVL